MARPGPKDSKRYIFNYVHRSIGLSAFLFSSKFLIIF